MAKKSKITEPTQIEQNVGEILSKTDKFIESHLKQIITVVGVVIILIIAIISIRHTYYIPKEKEAQSLLFQGERYFASQQWDFALNGDTLSYAGFLDVVDNYGFTKSGNLAKAYSGICYYHLGDYESALKYLEGYKQKDKILASTVTGLIGDTYAQMEQTDKAISHFKKAASMANSASISPVYLKKMAIAYESQNKYNDALDAYNTIKTKYPESQEAESIEKYIVRAKSFIK
ncbi:MAG: tetratricopeptide repeat protein [Dysgonamonadaceae bacterium]|jgi:tetratricopeptide (TPR) repeat protein|nr:tetratricopeptide repeat protein [Dysgonamonadaceae bacterium]